MERVCYEIDGRCHLLRIEVAAIVEIPAKTAKCRACYVSLLKKFDKITVKDRSMAVLFASLENGICVKQIDSHCCGKMVSLMPLCLSPRLALSGNINVGTTNIQDSW